MSVDEAIPTEQQLEELKSNSSRYLIDVKSALEKSWAPNYYFFSGSAVEGFGIPLMMSRQKVCLGSASKSALHADLDVMFCCSEVKASFSGQENILVELLVSESEGFTGYVQLISFTSSVETRFVSSNLNRLRARDAVKNTPVVNLPGTACCCGRINDTPKLKLHSRGPSMKLRIAPLFEADFTGCIHCPEWPTMSDWSSRPRH